MTTLEDVTVRWLELQRNGRFLWRKKIVWTKENYRTPSTKKLEIRDNNVTPLY